MNIQVKPLAIVAVLSVFDGSDSLKQDATMLSRFRKLIKTYSQEEIKEAIRAKDKEKGEAVSPFVAGLIKLNRCTEQSAGVRQSQFRTLYTACSTLDGLNVDELTGWNEAVKAAQTLSVTRKTAAKAATANKKLLAAVTTVANGKPIQEMTSEERDNAIAKADSLLAIDAMQAKRAKLDKAACIAATDAGGFFTIDGTAKQLAVQFCNRFDAKTARAIATAMLLHLDSTAKHEKQAAQVAEQVAAPVAQAEAVEA